MPLSRSGVSTRMGSAPLVSLFLYMSHSHPNILKVGTLLLTNHISGYQSISRFDGIGLLGCRGGFEMKRPTASPHPTPTQTHGIYSCPAGDVGPRARRVCAAVPVTIAIIFIASTTFIISKTPPAPKDRGTYLARAGKRVRWTSGSVR